QPTKLLLVEVVRSHPPILKRLARHVQNIRTEQFVAMTAQVLPLLISQATSSIPVVLYDYYSIAVPVHWKRYKRLVGRIVYIYRQEVDYLRCAQALIDLDVIDLSCIVLVAHCGSMAIPFRVLRQVNANSHPSAGFKEIRVAAYHRVRASNVH